MAFSVLVKDALEGLFEDGGGEGVGQNHEAVGVVAQALHFEQAHLVQAASKDVHGVSVVGYSLCHGLVELGGV